MSDFKVGDRTESSHLPIEVNLSSTVVFSNLQPGNNNNKERVVYNFSDKTVADLRKN
jgi:hypothetical protein